MLTSEDVQESTLGDHPSFLTPPMLLQSLLSRAVHRRTGEEVELAASSGRLAYQLGVGSQQKWTPPSSDSLAGSMIRRHGLMPGAAGLQLFFLSLVWEMFGSTLKKSLPRLGRQLRYAPDIRNRLLREFA